MRYIAAVLMMLCAGALAFGQIKKPDPSNAGDLVKNSIGMELVSIPPGEFMMGSTEAEVDKALSECNRTNKCKREWFTNEMPKHKVTIKDGFWIGKYEVTQGQWEQVTGKNRSTFKKCGADCPAENVSWDDGQEFINALNAKNDGFKYRLPTEAEWEYACRAGTTGNYYDDLESIAWYEKNSGSKTHPVGGKKPNAFGLYDMSGNVWEWVQDIYNEDGYGGLPTDGSANLNRGDSGKRVLRGGSWSFYASSTRSAFRNGFTPSIRNFNIGLRVAARRQYSLSSAPAKGILPVVYREYKVLSGEVSNCFQK